MITVAWLALVRPEVAAFVRAGSDAAAVRWVGVREASTLPLAFDHRAILAACLDRLRRDVWETDVTRELAPRAFTVPELRAVIDAVTGVAADPADSRRYVRGPVQDGVIVEAPGHRVTARRPARVFSFSPVGVSVGVGVGVGVSVGVSVGVAVSVGVSGSATPAG